MGMKLQWSRLPPFQEVFFELFSMSCDGNLIVWHGGPYLSFVPYPSPIRHSGLRRENCLYTRCILSSPLWAFRPYSEWLLLLLLLLLVLLRMSHLYSYYSTVKYV